MHEIFIPVTGMAPDDVVLVSWAKSPGESVSAGDIVAIVETSKAEPELQSDVVGVLGKHLFPPDSSIPPGTTIAYVLEHDEPEPSVEAEPSMSGSATLPTVQVAAPSPEDESSSPVHNQSPRQRRVAAETAARGGPADGSGNLDRGREDGTTKATNSQPPAAVQESLTDHRFREAISASVSRSWREIPHFSVTRELRVDALIRSLGAWRAVLPDLSLTDLLIRALALSFLDHLKSSDLDIGLAVATERGVTIPVIRDVPQLGLIELVDSRRAAVERAKAGRMHGDDARTPATTLSNLGAIGVDQFTGIVPYGQTSLLTVGRAKERPIVENGQLAVAATMHVSLNVDHRVWDGHHAGNVLNRLAQVVAEPAAILSDPLQQVQEIVE